MAFRRLAQLIIGPPGEQGIEISALRIAFSVKKTDSDKSNSATITVYNMGEDAIGHARREGAAVILRAGYEDEGGVRALFFGKIARVDVRRGSPDHEVNLEVYDGLRSRQSAQVSLSYGPGVRAESIVNDVVSALGLSRGNRRSINTRFRHGFSFAGLAKDALTKVLDSEGLRYTIQNEQLYITAPDEAPTVTAVVISPSTGLIGSPEDISENSEERWRVNSLLFPQLIPRAVCEVQSSKLNGLQRIRVAEFSGDTHEGDFMTTLEVTPV